MAESGSDHTTWMKDARFGMFIHWGLYSVPARQVGKGSLAEWIKSRERLNDDHYDAYFAHFVCGLVFTTRLWIGTTLRSPSMGSTPSATTESFKRANTHRDMSKYRDYLFAQVRELLLVTANSITFSSIFPTRTATPKSGAGKAATSGARTSSSNGPRAPARYRGQRPPRPPR